MYIYTYIYNVHTHIPNNLNNHCCVKCLRYFILNGLRREAYTISSDPLVISLVYSFPFLTQFI